MLYDFGFVVPLKAEAQVLISRLQHKKQIQSGLRAIYTGIFHTKKVSVIISGCGKIKSASGAQHLIDQYPAKTYIHFGTAGALSERLKIGDIIIANNVVEHDVVELFPKLVSPPRHRIDANALKKQIKDYKRSPLVWGTIVSGDEDIVTTKRKKELFQQHNGLCVDWESAGFALTCELNHVQGYVFRGISDYAHELTPSEYEKNQKVAIKNIMNLLDYLVSA